METRPKIKIVTHNASFHSDDVFAVASLLLFLGDQGAEIIRTRDESIIATGDYVIDVGSVYDASQNRFDHHQPEGAGVRENGVPYASFGLVWKHFGERIVGSKEIMEAIDKKIAQPVDAGDNGFDIAEYKIEGLKSYTVPNFVGTFNPTWKEDREDKSRDKRFREAVEWAKILLAREIEVVSSWIEGQAKVVEAYERSDDKRLIILNENDDYGRVLIVSALAQFSEPLYVVFPRSDHKMWQTVAVNIDNSTYETRKPLPKKWQGLRDDDFAAISRVPDTVFCHRSGFMCVAKSKEGAVKLAQLALEA